MKATLHVGKGGTKHNDRNFDVKNAKHINPELSKNNIYIFFQPGYTNETFEEMELDFYNKHYGEALKLQNEQYKEKGQKSRIKNMEYWLKNDKKKKPDEIMLQIGNKDEYYDIDVLKECAGDFFNAVHKKYGSNVQFLDCAFHDENGKKHQHKKCLGYFATKEEALNALTNYHNNHGVADFSNIKFIDLWNKWQETKEIQNLSASRHKGYTSTINSIPDNLKNAKFITLKYQHWQDFINDLKNDKGYSTIKRVRGDIAQLYDYAMKNDIIDKNYARMVDIGKSPKKGETKIFSEEQIRKMWTIYYYNQANEEAIFTIKTVLMLIYNGCRISEFLSIKTQDVNLSEQYFEIKEAKTEAGVRKVPIHDCMIKFYESFYDSNNEYLMTNPNNGKKYSYANYRDSYFDRLKNKLEWDEDITPHNCRKTCASLLKKYGVDATYQKLIIGHEGALDLTEKTYTYVDVEQLVEAINKIPSVDTL